LVSFAVASAAQRERVLVCISVYSVKWRLVS
jgi:hypothetical protein